MNTIYTIAFTNLQLIHLLMVLLVLLYILILSRQVYLSRKVKCLKTLSKALEKHHEELHKELDMVTNLKVEESMSAMKKIAPELLKEMAKDLKEVVKTKKPVVKKK